LTFSTREKFLPTNGPVAPRGG